MSTVESINKVESIKAGAPIKAHNDTNTEVIFSVFNAGDNFIPYYHQVVPAHGQADLEVGNFASVGIGVQVQSGGRWVGDDPKNPPYCTPGQTFTYSVKRGC